MLANSAGKDSASFTMMFIAFNISMVWLLLWVLSGLLPFTVPEFDGASIMAVITPLATLYFASNRKKNKNEETE